MPASRRGACCRRRAGSAATLWDLAASGDLWMHVEATLVRVGLGFALGAARGSSRAR